MTLTSGSTSPERSVSHLTLYHNGPSIIQTSKMNVWKYIYIKFYKFRRWGLGKTLGEDYLWLPLMCFCILEY